MKYSIAALLKTHRFLHNTAAVAGTFTAVGLVVAGLAIFFVASRLRKRRKSLDFLDEDDYVVNDYSGRTGFTSVNHGNNSVTEMTERRHGRAHLLNDEVEHTLGQEIIQHAPFDPFRNNFAYIDNTFPSDGQNVGTGLATTAPGVMDRHYTDHYDDLQANDDTAVQHAPWATQAMAEPAIPYRYSHHPYASEAIHVTPLQRQPSERAEYGLAC